jgi:hypothetical protein
MLLATPRAMSFGEGLPLRPRPYFSRYKRPAIQAESAPSDRDHGARECRNCVASVPKVTILDTMPYRCLLLPSRAALGVNSAKATVSASFR